MTGVLSMLPGRVYVQLTTHLPVYTLDRAGMEQMNRR